MVFTPLLYHETIAGGSITKLISGILYGLPICFLLMCVSRKWIFSLLSVIVAVTSFMETMMILLYNNYLTAGNLLAVINTTADEGGGFISSSFHELPFALPVLLGAFLAIYFRRGWFNTRRNCFLFVFSLLLAVLLVSYQVKIKWKGNLTTQFYVEQNVLSISPYNYWFQSYNAYLQIRQRSFIKDAEKMSFGANRPDISDKETYVLVIGESLRYDNLSLGGYCRSTTPMLESLDNVTLLTNYYSTANLTMYSVPQIITRATPDEFILNYKEKSLVSVFSECGFKTFVISSGNLLSYETYLSSGCDELFALTEFDDGNIAQKVDSLSSLYEKTFFIVQYKGNHSPYNNFEKEQDLYHPNPVSDKVSWTDHEAMVNAYDNTVLFTDKNVYNLVKAIDKPDSRSALVLVSDHGADYELGVNDHGGNCNPCKAEYHVPLIFWHNNKWGGNNQKKLSALKFHKDKPVNADNIFYTVCDMADITIAEQYTKLEWSLFNPYLQLHERRLLVPDGKNTIKVE